MSKRSKRFKTAVEKIKGKEEYSLPEAVKTVKENASAKFDESVEIAFKLGIDPKQPEQMVRSTVKLPHGTGKSIRVIAFAEGSAAEEAKKAGADVVGMAELAEKIMAGWMDFDIVVATPAAMKVIGKLGKVLGPKGLMPSPKAGTVSPDVAQAVKEVKAGKIEIKADKTSNLHAFVGKVSFDEQKLFENAQAVISAVVKAKPVSAKGIYMQSATLSSTMGPGLKLNLKEIQGA
ncbi:MAG: 50S ribosomal protein L1 [Candidatus Aureabacteria bacterium]|nr:50S ribosomal protein L1 [Candidatus Auribacterota bacterium]